MATDLLHRFIFEDAHVRGELVQLRDTFQSIIEAQDYPPAIKTLLGELLAATSLLTATIKFEGDISIQLQGQGLLKYAVINGSHDQKVRGVARWEGDVTDQPFTELMEQGVLVITITPEEGERYQGIVSLERPSLAECLQEYFLQSEQLLTNIQLRVSSDERDSACGGMLLQVLPQSSETSHDQENEQFDHLSQLTQTITTEELTTLSVEKILHRLYHEEDLTLFDPQPVTFSCSCSREKSAAALANIAKQELLDIIAEKGEISTQCQFCNTEYVFDAIDVESIHAGNHGSATYQ